MLINVYLLIYTCNHVYKYVHIYICIYIYTHECTHVYSSKHWCLSFMWEWCQSKYGIPASNIGVWSRIQEVSRLKWNRCSKPHQDAVSMTHRHTKCVGNLLIMYVLVYMYSINYFTYIYIYIYITHIYIYYETAEGSTIALKRFSSCWVPWIENTPLEIII